MTMPDGAAQPAPTLTRREFEVLFCVADGCTDQQTAHRLGMAPRTARFHISNATEKLHAKNRTHAIVLAIRSGLIGPEAA